MFSKKRSHSIDNRGQVLMLVIICLPLLISMAYGVLKFSRFIERKIALQNGVDAALLSGSLRLADGLSKISYLNRQLMMCHKLLVLVRIGKLITAGSGFVITEEALVQTIRLTSKLQDIIKKTYPLLATYTAHSFARKNKTPHVTLNPFFIEYAIKRGPPILGLPTAYLLDEDHQSQHEWSIKGHYYRWAYRATAASRLFGDDLLHTTWSGYLVD